MEPLNDDCVVRILYYLDLPDQMRLIHVHHRFKQLMPFAWRKTYQSLDLCLFGSDFELEDFRFFFESLVNSVQEVKVKSISAEKFDVLMTFVFPHVRDFRFSQRPPPYMEDSIILKIANAFPQLRTFSPHGRFTGEHFTKFEYLEHLTLSYCSNKFTVENFAKIVSKYYLKTIKLDIFERKHVQKYAIPVERLTKLEFIKVYSEELAWFDVHLEHLHNLKEIIVTCVEAFTLLGLCNKLKQAGKENISSLESCNTDNAVATVCNSNLKIKKLSIVTDSKLLQNSGSILFHNLKYLRELYFNVCYIGKESNFTHLLHNIPHVELLSLEECDCLFTDYYIRVDQVTSGRTKCLKLNFWHNNANINGKTVEVKWHLSGQSNLLDMRTDGGLHNQITFEPIRILFE